MPLMQGKGGKVRSSNIAKLRDEGYPVAQAAAIAFSEERRSSKPKK